MIEKTPQQKSSLYELYPLRNHEGFIPFEEIEFYKAVDAQLEAFESYLGISPVGSVPIGYWNKASDADILFFLNPNAVDFQVCKRVITNKIQSDSFSIHKLIHVTHGTVAASGILESPIPEKTHSEIASLTRLVLGKKIQEYRKELAEVFQKLPATDQATVRERAIEIITNFESRSSEKRSARKGNAFSDQDRHQLWVQRFEEVWLTDNAL